MTEKKTKGNGGFRFNFIDAALILIMVLAIGVFGYLLNVGGIQSKSDTSREVIYQISVKSIREEFRNLVSVGDTMVDAVNLFEIGEVIDVSYTDQVYYGVDRSTGTLVYSPYPGFLDMVITVRATADMVDEHYMISGFELEVGSFIHFRAPAFSTSGYCQSIEVVS